MSFLASLKSRASALLARTGHPAAPAVAAHAAAPRSSRLGTLPYALAGAAPALGQGPLPDWSVDPVSGGPLPTGPHLQLDPTAWQAARLAHRHGWFAALAFRAGQGDAEAGARATAALESWLRQDVPGTGLAWAHASDLAARLVHWQAGLAWLGDRAPAALREQMAGSAAWHLDHLLARAPQAEADALRRCLHHAGLVVGGFTFIDLDQARDAWSQGLAGLGADLERVMHPDGSAIDGAPRALAEVLWMVALARVTARANGAAFPAAADAALARGTRFVERLASQVGRLPAFGERFVGSVLDVDYPLAWSLWNAVCGLGLESGDLAPRSAEDPRLAWLGLPSGPEPPAPGTRGWSSWVWRGGGYVVSEMKVKNRPSRCVVHLGTLGRGSPLTHLAPMTVVWDLGELSLLADPGATLDNVEVADWVGGTTAHTGLSIDGRGLPPGTEVELDLARVDGKKSRARGHHDGWKKLGVPVIHQREVLLNQARLTVIDKLIPTRASPGRHAVQVLFQMGPGWTVEPDGKNFVARQANVTVVIVVPEHFAWSVVSGRGAPAPAGWVDGQPAPALVGSGGLEGPTDVQVSFEVR